MRIHCGLSLLFLAFLSHPCAEGIDETYVRSGNGLGTELLNRLTGQRTFAKSYAVVIGISDYNNYAKLTAPSDDAQRVRNFLRDEAKFDQIITLTDEMATRPRIEGFMERALPQIIQSNDMGSYFIFLDMQ